MPRPRGFNTTWLELRRGDDVNERALELLHAISELDDPAVRQFIRDLARSEIRAAMHAEADAVATFIDRGRDADLGPVQWEAVERVAREIHSRLRSGLALRSAELRQYARAAFRSEAGAALQRDYR